MRLEVILHSRLVQYSSDGKSRRLQIELPPDSTIANLISSLGIELPVELLLLALNGRIASPQAQLADGDKVHLMLPISGG